jgi:hypothetical protein
MILTEYDFLSARIFGCEKQIKLVQEWLDKDGPIAKAKKEKYLKDIRSYKDIIKQSKEKQEKIKCS